MTWHTNMTGGPSDRQPSPRGTWYLVSVDPGCGCCSYLTVTSFTSEALAKHELAAAGPGYVLEFEPDDDTEDPS